MPELAGRIADAFEARIREQEETLLSPLGVRSYETRGRATEDAALRSFAAAGVRHVRPIEPLTQMMMGTVPPSALHADPVT